MIRNAVSSDIDSIMPIYERARRFMAENGNPTQWTGGYPSRSVIESDIAAGRLFVCTAGDRIEGVFAFMLDAEPNYAVIEGAWLNDLPYGTIHRVASAGIRSGVASDIFNWCAERISNLRIDTHEDNRIMQHILVKNGFVRCGIVHIRGGSPRIAFQRISAPADSIRQQI